MFVEIVGSEPPVLLWACPTSVTKPLTRLRRALHVASNTTLQGHEPSGSASTSKRTSEEGAARSFQPDRMFSGPKPQVFMTLRPRISISTAIAMCVCVFVLVCVCECVFVRGVLCIISGVLNDLCSMRNWVALPEISAGLTLKPSFILGRLRRAGWTSQDRDLTWGSKSPGLHSQLFSKVKLM